MVAVLFAARYFKASVRVSDLSARSSFPLSSHVHLQRDHVLYPASTLLFPCALSSPPSACLSTCAHRRCHTTLIYADQLNISIVAMTFRH